MSTSYLALLRGVNVGGNNIISMATLRESLEADGFEDVRTYIQSGNVMFRSTKTDKSALAKAIEKSISKHFQINARVAVFSKEQWQRIIDSAPSYWGQDQTCKHNLLILLEPYDIAEVVTAIGELKPDIEALHAGEGVLYQSVSFKMFGRTTAGKLAANPVYKQMTIRNYNTATKLLGLI